MASIIIRNARLIDVEAISELTRQYAQKGLMLERSVENVTEKIRNFFVAEYDKKVIGSSAVSFFSRELAEIRTLAVAEEYRRDGVGRKLVEYTENILRDEGVAESFVLTLNKPFFDKLGYSIVDKARFPQKIWRDCMNCPKIMACDEIAMVKKL